MNGLGKVALDRGDDESARTYFEQALTAFRAVEDQWSVALACTNLGWVAHTSGDTARAKTWFGHSLSLHRALGHERGIANALCNIGRVAFQEHDVAGATAYLKEAVLRFRRLGERRGFAECLEELAGVSFAGGNPARASVCTPPPAPCGRRSVPRCGPRNWTPRPAPSRGSRLSWGPPIEPAWADGRVMSTDEPSRWR